MVSQKKLDEAVIYFTKEINDLKNQNAKLEIVVDCLRQIVRGIKLQLEDKWEGLAVTVLEDALRTKNNRD